jgi:membrane-bound ClpP family serine protease
VSYLKLLIAFTKARGRKRRPSLPQLSSVAVVNTDLDPDGSVLAGGELWRAQTVHGNSIRRQQTVTVVGFRNHFLLVEERS